MKRSKMVQILTEAIQIHLNCFCCKTDEEVFDTILTILEHHGMKPPTRELDPLAADSYHIEGWDNE